jgi:F-type H+-transporting ATPase subunit delta
MANDDLVSGYAQALLSVAEAEDVLDRVEDELFAFSKAVEQNRELAQAITDPQLPAENKKAVIADLLGERAHPVTANLVGFVVESGRARELVKIVEQLAEVAAERRQEALAEVRTAVALSDEQRERLREALSRATGRAVEIKVVVDPAVVGGIAARIGDEIFDGTVARRLADARQHLSTRS